jgi:dipeptidyl aminopeptidase/acylaminoacyl peptidase
MHHRLLVLLVFASGIATLHGQGTQQDYDRSQSLPGRFQGKTFRFRVEPNWFANGDRFWYRNDLPGSETEFICVDAMKGVRELAFDHPALAKALSAASKEEINPKKLPFVSIVIDATTGQISFTAFKKSWRFDPKTKQVEERDTPAESPKVEAKNETTPKKGGRFRGAESPDGKWVASVRENNVHLIEKATEKEKQISRDGTLSDGYDPGFFWSPDSKRLVVLKTKRVETRKVTLIESSPKDQVQPRVHTMNYAKPGDELNTTKPHLFDVENGKEIEVSDELFKNPWSIQQFRWSPDGKEFLFLYNQRGHRVLRVVGIDAETGKTRAVIDEVSKTFVDYSGKFFLEFLPETDEILWMSERDGWNHLYLYDRKSGSAKQITKGDWVVRRVERVDAKKRQLWLSVGGIFPEQDPYQVHFIRIDFDGTNLVKLTEGDGTHQISYSPDSRFLIDSYSRVDLPPVTELRQVSDGKKLCNLESTDASALMKAGFVMPERFVAKGRDGKTDIFGVIWRPTNFDEKKNYPVIEYIYAGPHDSHVPKRWSSYHHEQGMAELGFILVMIDGMGTSNRSKAFHDVCWKNLGDSGFPDRILWMKEAAKKYPSMDISKVGIYGGSAGGQSSTRALLAFGDFYKVAVSDCGCHDNRMDKVWWNELWMSYPVGQHYAEQSNVTQAHKLTGKLLLIVGEMDRNVDPTSTLQVVNALIKANKDFEMLFVPGGGHGIGSSPYGTRRTRDFFVKNLLGVEPRK